MTEAALWDTAKKHLSRYGVLKRIENSIDAGTADVVYCLRPSPVREAVLGWLELKHLPGWPARAATPVVVPHLTKEQVLFLEGWWTAGGRAHILLQVRSTYALLDVPAVKRLYKRELDRSTLLAEARIVGQGRFPTRELVRHLTENSGLQGDRGMR